ncbi:MAG: YicC family protein [Ruminiclostridium sp.]|nr:YicC family protein [Ruminiclostridium sp.]
MIRSMTGFGRGDCQEDGKEFQVEIKTVNHRYSGVFVKLPRQIGFLEEKVRDMVGKAISRGKIDVYITYNNFSDDSKCVLFDETLAKTYISAVEALRDKFGLRDDISVSLISKYPDVLKVEQAEEDEEKIWLMLKTAVENALSSLITMREVEGEGLKTDLLSRALYIEKILGEISLRAPDVVKEYKLKLESRIKDLLEQQSMDENRLAMEIAVFADRCSIDEEIVRLGSHLGQMREALNIQQPIGRKLDFLIQEMNREINTIGSKANDLSIIRNVVEIKSEIEKLREQVQNIE